MIISEVMRVLINVPKLSNPGGVSVLYNVLKIQDRYNNVELFQIHSSLPSVLGYLQKYLEFSRRIKSFDVVHLNPSLNKKSFLRDGIYAYIAKMLGKKVIVYWHGWENTFEEKIKSTRLLTSIFNHTFRKSETSIVLGQVFSDKLKDLGYSNKVIIETNAAESKYLTSPLSSRSLKGKDCVTLLFISRLQKEKGIYEAIETLKILNADELKYKLIIAGSGTEEQKVNQLAREDNNIEFMGYIKSNEKHLALLNSDILFFPTYYPEGLPLTILEGLMYGLPVVSRPVGGIPDIVVNKENGFITESKDPIVYAEILQRMVKDDEVYTQISENNINKSFHFTPKLVCERLMSYYKSVI